MCIMMNCTAQFSMDTSSVIASVSLQMNFEELSYLQKDNCQSPMEFNIIATKSPPSFTAFCDKILDSLILFNSKSIILRELVPSYNIHSLQFDTILDPTKCLAILLSDQFRGYFSCIVYSTISLRSSGIFFSKSVALLFKICEDGQYKLVCKNYLVT